MGAKASATLRGACALQRVARLETLDTVRSRSTRAAMTISIVSAAAKRPTDGPTRSRQASGGSIAPIVGSH